MGYPVPSKPLKQDEILNPLIIEKIKNGDTNQLASIYKTYRFEFLTWITGNYNCSREEAKDAYQFAILTLYQNVVNHKLTELNSSIKTYLFAIGKNKILENVKKAHHYISADDELPVLSEMGKWEDGDYETKLLRVEECLGQLGEPCRSLLELYYYHNLSMEDIAVRMKYKNRDTSKNLKHKCLVRLRRLYENKTLNK